MEIRILERGDASILARVDPDVFDGPVIAELAREFVDDDRHHIAVAIDDTGTVVGMATAVHYVHPDKPPQLFVNEVGVADAQQGRGIGRRLMEAILAHGVRLGCVEAWVATESDNAAARALYRTAGGVEAPESIVMYTFDLDGGGSGT